MLHVLDAHIFIRRRALKIIADTIHIETGNVSVLIFHIYINISSLVALVCLNL